MTPAVGVQARRPWPRWVLTLGVLVAGTFAVGWPTGGSPDPCAELAVGSIRESRAFTPAGMQRGRLPERPILDIGPGIDPLALGDKVPRPLDGMTPRYAVGSAQGPYVFYLDAPMDPEMKRSDFLLAGGVEFEALSMDGAGAFAPTLFAMGERAIPVRVGAFLGALVWADPTEADIRPHGLYWADATTSYSLVAVRGPEYLLAMGRDLVCGGGGPYRVR